MDLLTGSGKFRDDERETPPDPGESPPASTFAKTPLPFPGQCWGVKQRLATGRASQKAAIGAGGRECTPPTQPCHPTGPSLSPSTESMEPRKVGLALPKARELFCGRIIMALPHGGLLLLLKGRGVCWHPRGSGCCGCGESQEMPAWLLTVPCPPPCTRWQGIARGTVETPVGEVAGRARR